MYYYLKKHWTATLLTVTLATVLQFVQASINLLMMKVLDAVIALDFNGFIFWLVMDIVGWGVYFVLSALRRWSYSRTVRKLNNSVRRDMAATLLRRSYQDYHAQDKGEYLSWFTTGVNQIEDNAWDAFFSFAYSVSQVIANITVLSLVHWSLLPLALVSSAIMIVAPRLFAGKLTRLGEACARGQAAAVSGLKDLLGGYDILRFFGRTARFTGGVDKASDCMEKASYVQGYQTGIIQSVLSVVSTLSQGLTLFFCGMMVFWGRATASIFLSAGNLIGAITSGLNNMSGYRLNMSTSKPYFDRITVHSDDLQPKAPQSLEPVREAITVEGLCFRYGDKTVLENMTATFKKGGKYALTGPSGCGKSTLLKLILGWLPGYGGDIRFDGKSAKEYTPDQLQQQMSYIAQDVFLFNTTIRDNITLGESFTDAQMEKALRDSALTGDLENMPLGLDTPVGEEGGSLSGGQRQRVAIARALIHNRSILLVDEGTSALDQRNANIVEESLLANSDLTLILVSHHLTPERKAQFTQVYDLHPEITQKEGSAF